MLDDRDYMRQPAYYGPRLSLTVLLLIVNAACFVIEWLASFNTDNILFIQNYLALSLEGLRHGFLWQFLTYQFLHAGWLHLLFNCLAIFFFGRSVETYLGRKRFLALYLASGVIGGVMQVLFSLVLPQYFNPEVAVVGASAGASGLIAAFAVLNWLDRFTLVIYFFPVTMRGRTLFWGLTALAVIGILTPGSHIANAAHLGGILTGFFYVRHIVQGHWSPGTFAVQSEPPRQLAGRLREKKFWRAGAVPEAEEQSADEYLQNEVDPILDKISAHGIQSLTAREREILERARDRMAKR
jgi:membrane associated rhomboid family serine protease